LVLPLATASRALRYHRAMTNDPDENGPQFQPPDAGAVYARYLETCRRLGVEPVPPDRAQDLIAEWSATLKDRRPPLH
jgi:hypothetical protein